MSGHYSFPSYSQIYAPERRVLKRIRQFARFQYYRWYCNKEADTLIHFLNQNPQWQALFDDKPHRFMTVLRKYCDTRFNKTVRLKSVLECLTQMEILFSPAFCERLVAEKRIKLLEIDQFSLYINLNDIEPMEGLFAVSLRYGPEEVYDASFTVLPGKRLLIGSVQGSNSPQAAQLIKQATKALYGVRPMFMMVYLLKLIAKPNALSLIGIPHKHQVKYRFNDNSRLLFNYNEFWKENGAILNDEGYWQLSSDIECKPLEEIPSKKRSMYRKRYEMLDLLAENIKALA